MTIKKKLKKALGKRRSRSHKGDYGRVFVLAGSVGMSGACYLTTMAALRSGAGLVTAGVPRPLVLPLAKRFTEAMTLPLQATKQGSLAPGAYREIMKFLRKQDILAVGPGLSQNKQTQSLIRKVVLQSPKRVVVDADGLNAFRGRAVLLKRLKAPGVITPHPGEFDRLFGRKKATTDSARKARALIVARKYNVVVVLKGNRTVVASPKGEIYINQTGNAGMATGGSGDVLTGVIAGILGQLKDSFSAACFGVYIHGLAGDLAVKKQGEISLVASDLVDMLPRAFQKALGK